jgi:hypothetical protein
MGEGDIPAIYYRWRRRQPNRIIANKKGRLVGRPYFELSGNFTGTNCDWLITFGAPSG